VAQEANDRLTLSRELIGATGALAMVTHGLSFSQIFIDAADYATVLEVQPRPADLYYKEALCITVAAKSGGPKQLNWPAL
tara:strand:+ start:146 stop:385 length:240 start_codon:yes stop_codon:yes gene_type:complete